MCFLLAIYHNDAWQIWTKDPSLIALCNSTLLAFMAGVIMAYIRFTLTVVSVSLGPREARINLIANNIASWAIYIPLAYLMPIVWKWGISGFWWSDFYGEAFKVACLTWAVSKVDWNKASQDARQKAAAANEDPAECEKLEKEAFTSLGAYAQPTPNAQAGNLAIHSLNLMTRNAGEAFEKVNPSVPFHRTPGGTQKMVIIEDV